MGVQKILTNDGAVRGNRIMGTGVNPFGVGWAQRDYVVEDNIIQFQGIDTGDSRYKESWGERDAVGGFRITDYGGETERENLLYRNNLVLINARGGSQARGTQFWSAPFISDVRLTDSTIKVRAEDNETHRLGAVVTHGQRDPANNPVVYVDSKLVSDRAIIRFGDKYGRGHNHHFKRIKFRRSGNDPQFHTFVFDGEYTSEGHVVLDADFGEGTGWDDVLWYRTGTDSHYTVKWTLELSTRANATVTISNAKGQTVFRGAADADGSLAVPLAQARVSRPDNENWRTPSTDKDITRLTPHRVRVASDNEEAFEATVEMTERKTLELP